MLNIMTIDFSPKFVLYSPDFDLVVAHFMDVEGLEKPHTKTARNREVRFFNGRIQANQTEIKKLAGHEVNINVLDIFGQRIGNAGGFVSDIKVELRNGASELVLIGDYVPYLLPGSLSLYAELYNGPFTEVGKWVKLSHTARRAWLKAALYSRRRPMNEKIEIDGLLIDGKVSFLCALGEAVFGPLGYMGQCLDGLNDCVRGNEELGITSTFTLLWKNAQVSELAFLRSGQQTTYQTILEILNDAGIEVIMSKS